MRDSHKKYTCPRCGDEAQSTNCKTYFCPRGWCGWKEVPVSIDEYERLLKIEEEAKNKIQQ